MKNTINNHKYTFCEKIYQQIKQPTWSDNVLKKSKIRLLVCYDLLWKMFGVEFIDDELFENRFLAFYNLSIDWRMLGEFTALNNGFESFDTTQSFLRMGKDEKTFCEKI